VWHVGQGVSHAYIDTLLAKYSDYKLYIVKAEDGRVFYRAG